MSERPPEGSPARRLIGVLGVTHNAKLGAVAGTLVAVAVYGFFVVIPGQSPRSSALYLVLAFVVLVSTALLVTVVLTARTLAGMTMSTPRWIRRGGSVALVGGAGWALLAAGAPLVGRLGGRAVYTGALPLAPLTLVYGAWAVHAANRTREGYLGWPAASLVAAVAPLVAWLAVLEPGGYLGGGLRTVEPVTFLAVNLLVPVGTSLLGAAVVRAGGMPARSVLALLFALPLGLAGLTAATYLGAPALLFPALGVPTGGAWAVVGYDLRDGRGVPPAEAFGGLEVEV